jgi:predicted RNA-binding protein with RPS1 domain
MSEPLRAEVDSLHRALVATVGAPWDDLRSHINECMTLAGQVMQSLTTAPEWDDELLERCLSAIVLLDHLGMREVAVRLLEACQRSSTTVALARFAGAGLRWRLPSPSITTDELPADVAAQLGANLVLSGRYNHIQGEALASYLQEPVFASGSAAHFALASLAFDDAIFAARLPDARAALDRLEQLAAALMIDLGEDHPYLGLVLLTLSSAKCALAAVEGNIQDLRRYADVLAVAVQRASAQLGPEHAHTLGGLANLAHIEFEIALASRSPHDVRQCVDNLAWLEERAESAFGRRHPTVVVLAMNAAVARLEIARRERSVALIQAAETQLLDVARLCEERFGSFHPCTAIARSNAASAGFDVARARRSRPQLEHMATVLEDTVSQVSDSLGAGHATARALTRQLRACHRLLAGDTPWTEGGGTGTIVRTDEDEMWSLDDDYVPVYDTSPPAHGRGRDADPDADPIAFAGDLIAFVGGAFKFLEAGDVVEGVVARVDADQVLVDVNDQLSGVIPAGELSLRGAPRPEDVVSVGDTVETVVREARDAHGRLILSRKRAQYARVWAMLEAIKERDLPVAGTVVEVVQGGLILDIGLLAFLPASLVEPHRVDDLEQYLGRDLVAMILELDTSRPDIVLSRRAWLEPRRSPARVEFLARLRPGEHRGGVVASIVDFGAFVDLGGVEGLVPISELSWQDVGHPSEVVEVGQEVTVEVLVVDMERERVSLSLKALTDG